MLREGDHTPARRAVDAVPQLSTSPAQIARSRLERSRPQHQGLGGPPVGAIENWVADVWQVLLNIDRPGRRDTFIDLGGDSFAAIEFSNMLYTQLGVRMSVDSLADRPAIAAVVAGLHAGDGEQRQPIVRLRTNSTSPVCLMTPGIGGHAWIFAALAKALTVPCDVRALSLMDLRDGPARDMRSRIRSEALNTLQPEAAAGRPIVVAGYSFGARVAMDLACWLADQGVPVAKPILLDPDPLDSGKLDWDPADNYKSTSLAFAPGSPAARQLDADLTAVSDPSGGVQRRFCSSAAMPGGVGAVSNGGRQVPDRCDHLRHPGVTDRQNGARARSLRTHPNPACRPGRRLARPGISERPVEVPVLVLGDHGLADDLIASRSPVDHRLDGGFRAHALTGRRDTATPSATTGNDSRTSEIPTTPTE
ncbi:thioesterase domain-containing protein, partial [Mycolicibacterium sp.]|uniref:thioesterase domain-containing protein n=1 Tax=Mycolicibacterium sp. TaxID=2320850 RepID=UPI0028AEFE7B